MKTTSYSRTKTEKRVKCPVCKGTGAVNDSICKRCSGTGMVPESEVRKIDIID